MTKLCLFSLTIVIGLVVCTSDVARAQYAAPTEPLTFLGSSYAAPSGTTRVVNAGSDLQATLNAAVPADTIVLQAGATFTGNYVLPAKSGNAASVAVVDSYVSDLPAVNSDTQALCGWNGTGPFKIANNYLEGSGENVIFGGGDASIELASQRARLITTARRDSAGEGPLGRRY